MLRSLFAIVVVLHGLVHFWLIALARRWVEYKPEMGWEGRSWLLTPILGDAGARWVATVVFGLVAAGFVVGGIGVFTQGEWWRPVMFASAVISAGMLLAFWDGGAHLIVQKGLLGFLIDVAIIVSLLAIRWPAAGG